MKSGKRAALAAQSNLPPSTITPPIDVPCPPMNFVAECTTMSAPHSNGRTRYGVGIVLSTISGTPASWATAATPSMSRMSLLGLPIVSPKNAFVFGRIGGPPLLEVVGVVDER